MFVTLRQCLFSIRTTDHASSNTVLRQEYTLYIVYIYIENLIIASSFDIIILQNKVLQIDGMIIMAPMEMMILMAKMEMMIMMAKMALYFFFLFMEASSCSDLESCLAIVETWGEAVVGHELQGEWRAPVMLMTRMNKVSTSSSFFFNLASNCALAASPASKAAFCC